ncbi:MAG: CehA/McbA family metallohydrolase [Myxococcota bacterium]|nr:CehA/McbA family metallohydrolase [Myxococcota bacterium]
MASKPRPIGELVAMGIIAGLVAFGLAYSARPHRVTRSASRAISSLETHAATFELHPGAARVTVRSRDGAVSRDIDLSVVIDGRSRTLTLTRDDRQGSGSSIRSRASVPMGEDSPLQLVLELRADTARDALAISLRSPDAGSSQARHAIELRAELPSDAAPVFVPGVGPIADRATVTGGALIIDVDPHPIGLVSPLGPVTVDATMEDPLANAEPMRLSASTAPRSPADGELVADLRVTVGASSMAIWKSLSELSGVPSGIVRGRVEGTSERALIFGRDAQGNPQVRALIGDGGTFELTVPTSVVQWYAAIDPGRASGVVPFTPGTSRDLVLDLSPGGDLHVTIVDADGRRPLTARLLVHGVEGTVDPSFGPDYRASGAGPIIDSLRGDITTPLPGGRYRIAATKGLEWSVDAKIVDIVPGRATDVELAPRHVVPTPGVLGCDLHVHARPSFDTPVTMEDRVLSLVAAGVDFAVPTEHNIVGDYSSALDTLELRADLLSVPGIEVTTYSRGFGHFGVFPYSPALPIPPFKHTTMSAIFRAVRADPSRFFQLNHPRLPKGIGYLSNIGFDPKAPRSHIHSRIDFDGIEVFNGYDAERPDRVEQVLRDYWALLNFGWHFTATGSSDSHRIQFHWAGYPRTMVTVNPHATLEADPKVDPAVVVANIKKGHATVTSGPIIELELEGAQPGDDAVTTADPVHGHVRVRAAPWVDVTRVVVIVGGQAVQTFSVPSRRTELGSELGTLEEAQARTVRFDRDIDVPIGPENGWVQVVAEGDRRMDDVLPYMPVPPLAFTNPVYVVRHHELPPPFPGTFAPSARPPP